MLKEKELDLNSIDLDSDIKKPEFIYSSKITGVRKMMLERRAKTIHRTLDDDL